MKKLSAIFVQIDAATFLPVLQHRFASRCGQVAGLILVLQKPSPGDRPAGRIDPPRG